MTGQAVTRPGRKQWLFLLLTIATLYVLLPQIGIFRSSFKILGDARWPDLWLAVGFSAATYVAAATTYCLLAVRSLRFGRTVLVQLASMFVNRLLPAGIGGIGANYAYLRKNRHSLPQASSVVAANNLLGFVGHGLLLSGLLIVFHDHLASVHLPKLGNDLDWAHLALLTLIIAAVVWARRFRRRLFGGLRSIGKQLLAYRQHPLRLLGALGASMALTLCNVASLYACSLALHSQLSFVSVLLVFSVGILLGTATPTPGGLGGMEAGLVAALVAYHVSSATALAIVLAYRLISYWLALAVGAGCFVVAQRRHYF